MSDQPGRCLTSWGGTTSSSWDFILGQRVWAAIRSDREKDTIWWGVDCVPHLHLKKRWRQMTQKLLPPAPPRSVDCTSSPHHGPVFKWEFSNLPLTYGVQTGAFTLRVFIPRAKWEWDGLMWVGCGLHTCLFIFWLCVPHRIRVSLVWFTISHTKHFPVQEGWPSWEFIAWVFPS